MYHGDTGDIYDGCWLHDQAHGKGVYTNFITGAVYEGQWEFDKQSGYGVETWPDGTVYRGQFRDGLKDGKGVIEMLNDRNERYSYQGEFIKNKFQGYGVYSYPRSSQKREYRGYWQANQMHGIGTLTWKSGRVFEGKFVCGEIEGGSGMT